MCLSTKWVKKHSTVQLIMFNINLNYNNFRLITNKMSTNIYFMLNYILLK